MKRRVVVTGTGMITAHGAGKAQNWEKTKAGQNSIREINAFDSGKYRGKHGGEAREFIETSLDNIRKTRLDRASHLLIHTAREALLEAGILQDIQYHDILVALGTTLGGMLSGEVFHREVIERGPSRARLSRVLDYFAHYQAINLFKEFRLKGDFVVFSDACASSTSAFGYAFNSIRSGEHDIAICGGYETMSEFTFAGFNSLMAVTPTLCRPFDRQRDGLVLGEGAGILVLEELKHAVSRDVNILCEIAGYGESSDAYHMTSPDPSGRCAALAMTRALKDAGCSKVDYINAHGTGTKYNDVMEAKAINIAFREVAGEIPVSSIKPMIGHLLGSAGAAEAIISILSIVHNTLPPNINYKTPDPECNLNIITEAVRCNVRTALSNSFGFGGSNASLILREYPWEG